MKKVIYGAFVSILLVSGCKEEKVSLTDEQILSVFGAPHANIFGASRNDAPFIIPRSTTECFHIISTESQGGQEAIAMQAMCRDELGRVLTRQDSIPDLSLDKLANSEFAAQLTAVSERQSFALEAWQEEQRAATHAERVAAEEKRWEALALELEKRREHAAEMRAVFHASIGPLREGCEAYLAAYRGIQEINRGHRIIGRPMPRPCVTHGVPLGQQEQEIESQYERIMRFELPNPLGPFGSLPFVRDFDPESYERMQETLDERLTEIEEILAGLTNR